jgi:hypothetical protein
MERLRHLVGRRPGRRHSPWFPAPPGTVLARLVRLNSRPGGHRGPGGWSAGCRRQLTVGCGHGPLLYSVAVQQRPPPVARPGGRLQLTVTRASDCLRIQRGGSDVAPMSGVGVSAFGLASATAAMSVIEASTAAARHALGRLSLSPAGNSAHGVSRCWCVWTRRGSRARGPEVGTCWSAALYDPGHGPRRRFALRMSTALRLKCAAAKLCRAAACLTGSSA